MRALYGGVDFLQQSLASPFGSGSQRLRNSVVAAEACSRSQHPVDVWAFALRLDAFLKRLASHHA